MAIGITQLPLVSYISIEPREGVHLSRINITLFTYELVGAEHVLGVCPGVGGRHDLAHPLAVAVDGEAAGVALGTRHVRHRRAQHVPIWKFA